ncbi:hypothetical protein P4S66_08790 [Pseudoalteromonas sp. B129b]
MSATFKIVFNGQLYQNTDLTSAQEKLSQLLNIPHNIVVQLFDGKAYALKKTYRVLMLLKQNPH